MGNNPSKIDHLRRYHSDRERQQFGQVEKNQQTELSEWDLKTKMKQANQ